MLLFSKSRSLSSRRKNTSCHLVCLTALQAGHPWTVEKEIQRVSKNKSNSLSARKGFFHAGNGKTLRAKQNRADVQIFRGDKKKIEPFQKLVNEYYKTQCFLIEKFVVVEKNTETNIFSRQQNTTLTSCEAFAVFKTSIRRLLQIKISHFFSLKS